MQKMLVAIILVGNLALAASAALAGDGLHDYSDKLLNGASLAIGQEQASSPVPDDPPAIKKFNQYRDDNMVP